MDEHPNTTAWRLVPVEPTIGMCIAGDEARMNVDDLTRTPAIYRAMLAAAPTPPEPQAMPQVELPPLSFAAFDEFGLGADDRVQDYARTAIEADRLRRGA